MEHIDISDILSFPLTCLVLKWSAELTSQSLPWIKNLKVYEAEAIALCLLIGGVQIGKVRIIKGLSALSNFNEETNVHYSCWHSIQLSASMIGHNYSINTMLNS